VKHSTTNTQAHLTWVSVQTFSRKELAMDASTTTKPHTVKRYPIRHPLADIMSVVTGMHSYSGENTSEIAFFLNNKWVVTPIEPFADYHDGSPNDSSTAVYPWVPNELIEAFLQENGV
jgi:hypothetical protein